MSSRARGKPSGVYRYICLALLQRERLCQLESSKYFICYNSIDFIRRSHCTHEEVLQEYELVIV